VKFSVTFLVLYVLVIVSLTPTVRGEVQYHVIGLDMVRASGVDTHIGDIQIVGVDQPPGMSFRGAWQTLGNARSFMGVLPGGFHSEAFAVRDGFAVGSSHGISPDGLNYVRAFIYNHTGGEMMSLDNISDLSEAFDLNNNYVVGTADFGTSISPRPTIWDRTSGTMTEIGNFPRGETRAINNNNQVVGNVVHNQGSWLRKAFRLLDGLNDVELLDIPNALQSFAWDINDSGDTVGTYVDHDTGATHAFIWKSDGTIEFPSALGGSSNTLTSINVHGLAGGHFLSVNNGPRAYLFDPILGPRDLTDLIDPASGWTLREITGITDEGYLVGFGTNAAGRIRGFIAIPVPGPGSGVIVAFTAVFGARRRR